MRWALGVVVIGVLLAGVAGAQVTAGQLAAVLTPANLASLAHNPVARLEVATAMAKAGWNGPQLGGQPHLFAGVSLAGSYRCRVTYFSPPHAQVGDWKPCTLGADAEGPVLTVPGLYAGHLLDGGPGQKVFYGVRLAEGSAVVPRYGLSPARDVAGFFYALGGGKYRLEIAAVVEVE